MSKKLILAGASGFLGSNFTKFAQEHGFKCKILTRNPKSDNHVFWDGKNIGAWCEELSGALAVINFAGANVKRIFTKKNKKLILHSRLNAVKAIHNAIDKLEVKSKPKLFLQCGGSSYYGSAQEVKDEKSPAGDDFLAKVSQKWEDTFFERKHKNVRACMLRIGLVLGKGGALKALAKLTQAFLGSSVGNGKQWLSWIHINDLNRILLKAVVDDKMKGIYNAVSTSPTQNRDFMCTLRKIMHRPWTPPVPKLFVKIASPLLLGTDASLALNSNRCLPKRLCDEHDFGFQHEDLEEALKYNLRDWKI